MKVRYAASLLTVTLLIALLAGSLATSQKSDQAEVLLQAANHKQVVEGKLEEAILLYKRIVQEFAGNRAIAAKALASMGECYEKLKDNKNALKNYRLCLKILQASI